MDTRETTVGIIGVGNIGMGMAKNLLKAGFPLVACDVRQEPLRTLQDLGARIASSPREVAQASGTVLAVVLDYAQIQAVVEGPHGVKEGVREGDTFIICSTIAPQQVQEVGQALAPLGVAVLDAPVSGGREGAEAGTLSIMVGGEESTFQRCRRILEAVGEHIYYAGPLGSGEKIKAINQLLVGVHLVATAEAVVLGKKGGLDPQLVYEVINQSLGYSRVFAMKAPRMIAHDFQPRGILRIFLKDLGIVASMAEEAGSPVFLTHLSRQIFATACTLGLGEADDSAVVQVLERLAGMEAG
ncbi:MAG: NAD(P)-dependent oxidoreductase [Nitrospinota bacterium]|nr:MAG: NAD(P)-dependent oxidoreductase [Nitrospinota bacterium]